MKDYKEAPPINLSDSLLRLNVMESGTYQKHVRCTNCGYRSTTADDIVRIPKGVTIDEFLSKKLCPKCDCNRLTTIS